MFMIVNEKRTDIKPLKYVPLIKMEWRPTEDGLTQIMQLLKDTQSPCVATQRRVQEKLVEMNEHLDFNNHLMFVLTQLKQDDDPTRSLSGLILKNNIRSNYQTIPSKVWVYIKQECLNGIGDQSPLIRTTICIIIRNILEKMGLHFWPELFPTLCEVLDSREHSVCEGAASALKAVCEVSIEEQDLVPRRSVNYILNVLTPRFIKNFKEASTQIRSDAVENVRQFNDVIELIKKFSATEHMYSLNDRKKNVTATKTKQFKAINKNSRSHKRSKLTKSSRPYKTRKKQLHKGKCAADTKTIKQEKHGTTMKKLKEKGKKTIPPKALIKKKLLRERTNDAKLSDGPLEKLDWSDWHLAICHTDQQSITSKDFKKSSIFDAYHRKSLFNKDTITPAIYEIGVKKHSKFKRKIHVMLIRTCTGYRGNKNLIPYLLYNKNTRKEVKRLLQDKFEIHIRRGVVKRSARGSVEGFGWYICYNYDYAWCRHGNRGHRKLSRDNALLSDPLL